MIAIRHAGMILPRGCIDKAFFIVVRLARSALISRQR